MENQMERMRERDDEDVSKDRLSKLPESVLQHILSLLDQASAVKTSALSKPWRYLWCTRPMVEFAEGSTVDGDTDDFVSAVNSTLQIYRDQKVRLQVFSLSMSNADGVTVSLLNKWIPVLVHKDMGVETLNLTVYSNYSEEFELPSPVSESLFESESLRSLTLRECVLKSMPARIDVKHLQKLCFHHVHVSEETLELITLNCPSVDDVSISDSSGFTSVNLLSEAMNLKHVRLVNNYIGTRIKAEIGSSNIGTLRNIKAQDYYLAIHHNQTVFSHLTRMVLRRVILFRSDLFSCAFPCLEELSLVYVFGIQEFNLISPSLKHLDITNVNKQFVATIDAPNIVRFIYEGELPKSISFSAAKASYHDWKSDVILTSFWKYYHTKSSLRLNRLIGLLKALSQSETTLAIDENMVQWLRNQHIANNAGVFSFIHMVQWLQNKLHNEDDDSKDSLPVVVEHLMVVQPGKILHSSSTKFLNSLFRLFRPRFIHMESFTNPRTKLHEVPEILLKEKQMVQCEFWQRVLEGASFQALYTDESEWVPVQSTSLSEIVKEEERAKVRVQLKWIE